MQTTKPTILFAATPPPDYDICAQPDLAPWRFPPAVQHGVWTALQSWVPMTEGMDTTGIGEYLRLSEHKLTDERGNAVHPPPDDQHSPIIATCMKQQQLILNLGSHYPGFEQTFKDSVTARPPRGTAGQYSTYWVDCTLSRLNNVEPTAKRALAWGNHTTLVRDNNWIIAYEQYGLFEDETVEVEIFRAALTLFRTSIQIAICAPSSGLT